MTILWNKVTWYSKLLAVIVFVGTFWLAFSLGTQWGMNQVENDSTAMASNTDSVTLAVGEEKIAHEVAITLNSVVQDSRCPIDVRCIQAGAINTNVTISVHGKTITKNFPSDEVPFKYEGYAISISSINPPRQSGSEAAQKDYRITFHVAHIR